MKATIITIGDELLNGQTIDTNAAWLGQKLNDIGVDVRLGMTIKDTHEAITSTIAHAAKSSDLLILTGGLGPTKDDVTKQAIADYYEDELVFNEENYAVIESLFKRIGREPKEAHRAQSYMPTSATLLENHNGTAPGMWFEKDGTILLSMPGVPREMKGIMKDGGLDKIQAANTGFYIIHHIIRTAGQGETYLAEAIEDLVDQFPEEMSMAYLPGLASVRLRISAKGRNQSQLEEGELCIAKGIKIGTAESCTGGRIAHLITQVPGSSAYYEGSIVSYSNSIKAKALNVSQSTLDTYGAVSEQTVTEMVHGAIDALGVDVSVAVSGIAGPTGGSAEKPVGTVWIAVGNKEKIVARKWQLVKNREINISYSTVIALNQLRLFIEERL